MTSSADAGRDVQRHSEGSPPPGERKARDDSDQQDADENVRGRRVTGLIAEIARGPDAEHLKLVQRVSEVCHLAARRDLAAARPGDERSGDRDRRYRQDGDECDQSDRHPGGRPQPAGDEEGDHRGCRYEQPHHSGRAENREQRGRGEGGGERRPHARPLTDRRDEQGAEEGDHRHRGELLDSAPERIGHEQSRLSSEKGDECPERSGGDQGRTNGVDRESEHGAGERERRLEQPRDVLSGQLAAEAERHERPEWIAGPEVVGEHLLVRRGGQPGERAAVIHHPIGERQPRRGVVERDVAGERRLPGEDDRGGVDSEDRDRDSDRPRVERPASCAKPEADDRERDRERCRELGGRSSHGDETGLDDQ